MVLWKFAVGMAIVAPTFIMLFNELYDPSLEFDDGIRAALFALAAAMILFVVHLPTCSRGMTPEKWINVGFSVVGAAAALLAAWFWLSDETVKGGGKLGRWGGVKLYHLA